MALQLLSELELPDRRNLAMQTVGSTTCGAFVLFWMEQVCRAKLLNEAGSSMGWPSAGLWGGRLKSLVDMLLKEQVKLKQAE